MIPPEPAQHISPELLHKSQKFTRLLRADHARPIILRGIPLDSTGIQVIVGRPP